MPRRSGVVPALRRVSEQVDDVTQASSDQCSEAVRRRYRVAAHVLVCDTGGSERARTILAGSRGWQMRDVLEVCADEFRRCLAALAGADDVRSDPPPADDRADPELWRRSFGPATPTLTLSDRDITVHRAKRFVTVSPRDSPG